MQAPHSARSETVQVPSAHAFQGARFEPITLTAGLLKGRWRPLILWNLFWEGKTFFRLARAMPGISKAVLTRDLADLVAAGLVERRRTSSEAVEFAFSDSPLAQRLRLLVGALYDWGLAAGQEAVVVRLVVRRLFGFQEVDHSRATVGEPGRAELADSQPPRFNGGPFGGHSH